MIKAPQNKKHQYWPRYRYNGPASSFSHGGEAAILRLHRAAKMRHPLAIHVGIGAAA